MCGLFGTIRPLRYPAAMRGAAAALLDLGRCAEERGTDSAGLATLHARCPGTADRRDEAVWDRCEGRWRLTTALGAFGDLLPDRRGLPARLRTAQTVLGHTRWATQGTVSLDNASPLLAGDVLGTHNGDVTTPRTFQGGTDSAWLLGQLDRSVGARATLAVLAGLRGRAALAWARLSWPGHVFLARAALSPLAVATDRAGALWWASNPEWLRAGALCHDLGLTEPVLLHEGTLLSLRAEAHRVTVTDRARFIATARWQDERIADLAAWRGFTDADRRHDQAHLTHRVPDIDAEGTAGHWSEGPHWAGRGVLSL